MSIRKFASSCGLAMVFVTGVSRGDLMIDGLVSPGDGYGPARAIQDTATGFGALVNQLDGLYARFHGAGGLALALTGNLESNGNGIVIFLDTKPGGAVASTLGGGYGELGSIGGQRTDDWGTDIDGTSGVTSTPGGSILDPGFNPDLSIEFNTDGGTRWMNVIDLTIPNDDSPSPDTFLGSGPLGSGALTHPFSGGFVTHDFDNSNDQTGASATKGLELSLDAEALDAAPGHEVKVFAFITNGGGDYLSNQLLPGIGGGGNLAGADGMPLYDARDYSGDQFVNLGQAVPEASAPLMMFIASMMVACGCFVVRMRRKAFSSP